ncbi:MULTISPECIES: hypothetical protein [unclassified Myroides]|uniref:hypothetical protein n=1 Tax=unclassified Myroides TaxID=2642485 RepID=UPI003D2F9426
MKPILYLFCFFLGVVTQTQAQNHLFGPSISYQYQNRSMLKTGIYYATELNFNHILKVDATANFTWMENNFMVIPELAATYYSEMYYIGLLGRTELTPYTLTPKVGLSFATFIELDVGYGFPLANKGEFGPIRGFTTSLRLNIPINTKL